MYLEEEQVVPRYIWPLYMTVIYDRYIRPSYTTVIYDRHVDDLEEEEVVPRARERVELLAAERITTVAVPSEW